MKTAKERMEAALEGRKEAGVPQFTFHDLGYIMRSQGHCVRDYRAGTMEERADYIVNAYSKHGTEGYFVHPISDVHFEERNRIEEKGQEFYIIRDLEKQELYRMNRNGDRFTMEGVPYHMLDSSFESKVTCEADIKRLLPSFREREDVRYAPLHTLSQRYPDHHFAFQLGTPFVGAIDICGGYEAGMCMMMEEPELMKKLMEARMESELETLPAVLAAGGRSVYYTSYYTGADTISPKMFEEQIWPFELEMMRRLKEAGVYVIYWFLGDMNPLLDLFAKMPFDAIAPEQPRKGYGPDYRLLRQKLGSDRCIFSYTYESQMVECDREGISNTFHTLYDQAGRDLPFVAANTITPEDADPRALDYYREVVEKTE